VNPSPPSARRSWLASRHLARSAQGDRALSLVQTLGPELRERILLRGDELAVASMGLAHGFFVAAVDAASVSAGDFDAWESAALALLDDPAAGRETAQAWFALPARTLLATPRSSRDELVGGALELARVSRRLATRFLEATGAALAASSEPDTRDLAAWLAAARGALGAEGWRGEFLAGAILESSATLLELLDADGVDAWAQLVVAVGSSGRTARSLPVPATLASMPAPLRTPLLRTVVASLPAGSTVRAEALLLHLPRALAALPDDAAAALLEAAGLAAADPTLPEALDLVGPVLHGMPANTKATLMARALDVAREFPAGLPAYLRTMGRALEEGGLESMGLWVGRGIASGRDNPEAGIAHFRLESRTSHKILTEHTAAVTFEEVEPWLQRYVVLMSRRPFQLTASPGIWLRPPLGRPEDPALRLPDRVDLCSTAEDNALLYKLTIAHTAARWEYGTNDFELPELLRRGWSPPAPEQTSRSDVIGLLESFPNPLLAAALFVLLDGARLDACLARDFAGLAPELDRMGRLYAANPPRAAADRHAEYLLEALFQLSVGRLAPEALQPRLRTTAALVVPALEVLRAPEATVYDSAALVCAFYGGLSMAFVELGEEEGQAGSGDFGGATIIDYDDAEGSGPFVAGDNDGPERPRPPATDAIDNDRKLELSEEDGPERGGGRPLSAEEIRKLLESGADFELTESHGQVDQALGLYITDLLGKLPGDAIDDLRERMAAGDAGAVTAWLVRQASGDHCFYDEWDHTIGDYRRAWCRLFEVEGASDGGVYYSRVLAGQADLVSRIRREFQMMRPEQFRKVRRMQDGEDFDLNAVVEAHADRRTRRTPSDRLYVARRREERDVATLFLVDMSASTDEPMPGQTVEPGQGRPRRVVELIKDTLVLLSAVLEEIGDAYAIHGFSGHGRANVEYYTIKSFNERLSDEVRGRLGGIEPKRSTRMGAALRHSAAKLGRVSARARHLILLSDGFPQDFDYGEDRRSNVYGLRDTTRALEELEGEGVGTFCITIDPAGHDYLGEMCPQSRYAVIEDVAELPEELPRIYRRVTQL
jgi:nitric oxide reductase NorD protein